MLTTDLTTLLPTCLTTLQIKLKTTLLTTPQALSQCLQEVQGLGHGDLAAEGGEGGSAGAEWKLVV